VLFDDGQGTVIYRIPRTYAGIGRVVNEQIWRNVGPIHGGLDTARLIKYAAETEKPGRQPVSVTWRGLDEMSVSARTEPGEAVLLQETWDPAWVAEENGEKLEVRRDPSMGFILIPVKPGAHHIRVRFTTPPENRLGQIVTGFSAVFVLGFLCLGLRNVTK
jgi:hypothetical protein